MKLQHFKELDGVRALAALSVMLLHFFQNRPASNTLISVVEKISILGQGGVTLFFVLSGFLITRILVNSKQSGSYFKDFYIRRALRILPLYYLFLIIYYFVMPVMAHGAFQPFKSQIWFWIYLQNIAGTFGWKLAGPAHYWSLAIEEQFYLIWPFIIYYLDIPKIRQAIYLTILISFLVKFIMLSKGLSVFFFTLTRMDELAIGALLALFEINGQLVPKNLKKFTLIFTIIAIPTGVVFIALGGKGLDIVQFTKFTLVAVMCFSFICLLITMNDQHWLKRIFKVKPLVYTGKISYGLYIFHPLCFYLIGYYFNPQSIAINLTACFAVTYIVASLSYYLFESRFLALKQKFSYNN